MDWKSQPLIRKSPGMDLRGFELFFSGIRVTCAGGGRANGTKRWGWTLRLKPSGHMSGLDCSTKTGESFVEPLVCYMKASQDMYVVRRVGVEEDLQKSAMSEDGTGFLYSAGIRPFGAKSGTQENKIRRKRSAVTASRRRAAGILLSKEEGPLLRMEGK
ncbi:hypothetical protein CDAR_241121 [Caerostris darwini]|uniref:Uncharacterized protein n=1 Tax=Caerostris darwini TaxID=1538125 RepID=A0AAV4TJC2_9ARAC|nr:hypothetical protein CDAR_241121 [Caerostris darwini]